MLTRLPFTFRGEFTVSRVPVSDILSKILSEWQHLVLYFPTTPSSSGLVIDCATMASQLKAGTSKKDKRIDAITGMVQIQKLHCTWYSPPLAAFAHKIKKQLPDLKDKDDIRRFTDELEDQTRAMKLHPSNDLQRNNQLNSLGIDVWNTCVSLSYDEHLCTGSLARALVYTRVFAFQLLVLGQCTGNNEPGDLSRLAKIALKTGKACIGKHN